MFSIAAAKPSRLDPRTRLSAIFVPALIIGTTLDPASLIILTLTTVALSIMAGVTAADLRRAVVPALIFCTITLTMHLLFTRAVSNAVLDFGILSLNLGALKIGLLYCWRIALFFAVALAFTRWISQEEFAESIWRILSPLGKLGVPVQGVCMALTIAIRFIPQIFAEHRRIEMAQRARGANPGGSRFQRVRHFVPLLVPTMASALRRISTTADALTVRAWGSGPTRTFYREAKFTARDAAIFAVIILLIIILVVLP